MLKKTEKALLPGMKSGLLAYATLPTLQGRGERTSEPLSRSAMGRRFPPRSSHILSVLPSRSPMCSAEHASSSLCYAASSASERVSK